MGEDARKRNFYHDLQVLTFRQPVPWLSSQVSSQWMS